MKKVTLKICGETVQPGESISLALPLPELFSCAPLYMPVKIIHGKKPGPCLLISAAMYGNELNGTEIINRLLEMPVMKRLRGTLIAVPVLNVYGLINRTRNLPGGTSLDRCFPGSKTGTHGERAADLFTQEIFQKADVCIDLQTGSINHSNLPQIYVSFSDEKSKALAEIFNAPVISNVSCEKGTLRSMALKKQKPFLLYEAGEAMRFDEHSIKVGLKGILNIMRKLQMISDKSSKREVQLKSFFTDKNIWVRASTSGISHTKIKLGQFIKKGEVLCEIKDPIGKTPNAVVTCPEEAIIVGMNNLPLVYEGESLFQLAVFPRMEHAATHLGEWKSKSRQRETE